MMVATSPSTTLSWPSAPPHFSAGLQDASAPGTSVLCATFSGTFDQQGRAHMELAARGSLPVPAGGAAAGADTAVSVRPGHGVIVRESGSDPATAPEYLLTDAGQRYELVDPAPLRLGYDGVASCEVPAPWLRLVPKGTPLDPAKAGEAAVQ